MVPFVVFALLAVGVARWGFVRMGRGERERNVPRVGVVQGEEDGDVEWDDYRRELLELREGGGLHAMEHVVLGRRSWDDQGMDSGLHGTSFERSRSKRAYGERIGRGRYNQVKGDGVGVLKPFEWERSSDGLKRSVAS